MLVYCGKTCCIGHLYVVNLCCFDKNENNQHLRKNHLRKSYKYSTPKEYKNAFKLDAHLPLQLPSQGSGRLSDQGVVCLGGSAQKGVCLGGLSVRGGGVCLGGCLPPL